MQLKNSKVLLMQYSHYIEHLKKNEFRLAGMIVHSNDELRERIDDPISKALIPLVSLI